MSKSENEPVGSPRATDVEDPEYRALHEQDAEYEGTEYRGAFGYEDGLERDREREAGRGSEVEREGDPLNRTRPEQTTTGAVNRDMRAGGAEDEARATTLSTAEPAATMHQGSDYQDFYHQGFADGTAAGRDDELDQDSMTGDAVMTGDAAQTRPQTTPMQPAPAAAAATTSSTGAASGTQGMASAGSAPTAQSPLATDPGPVLAPQTSLDFRERWHGIQAEFIDDPRRAVEDADRLVMDVARAFAAGVEERRRGLTSGWEHDGHGETEELRLAMRQYRALVDHLLHD